jgi:hypothetical protein
MLEGQAEFRAVSVDLPGTNYLPPKHWIACAERHALEYYRHSTLSLYAALDAKTGKVEGRTAKRHSSQEFIAFVTSLFKRTRWAREIHIVLRSRLFTIRTNGVILNSQP